MKKSSDHIALILERVQNEGAIDLNRIPAESKFRRQLLSILPNESDTSDTVSHVCYAIESLLLRSHIDTQLLVALCGALKTLSDMPFPKFLRAFDKALQALEVPVGSWISKNMRAARVIESHPSLTELTDIEALCALDKLPEGSLKRPHASGPLVVGDEEIDISAASKKEIVSAVRKVKSDISKRKKKKLEATAIAKQKQEDNTPPAPAKPEQYPDFDQQENLDLANAESVSDLCIEEKNRDDDPLKVTRKSYSLASELSEAELIISRLLSTLPQDERLLELASALENTRKLVVHARADLQSPISNNQDLNQADLH